MEEPETLESLPEISVSSSGAPRSSESSDEDDQFADAKSVLEAINCSSPIPKRSLDESNDQPSPVHDEVPSTDALEERQDKDEDEDEDEAEAEDYDDEEDKDKDQGHQDPAVSADNSMMHSAAEGDEGPEFADREASDHEPSYCTAEAENIRSPVSVPSIVVQSDDESHDRNEDLDEDFGEDFDDFAEGGHHDDEFDDFEDGFQQAPATWTTPSPSPIQPSALPFPILEFDDLSTDKVTSATQPHIDALFPPEALDFATPAPLPRDSSTFITPRSASLWSQLVAPPPLAPPDWIRSRTRRLFLVSLGVPVDLDEILPASKQKKLVLPSLNVTVNSPRNSTDSRGVSRLRHGERNASSTSVDTQGRPKESKRRKGPPPQPQLDLVGARYLCTTTDEALDGMTMEELESHVAKLEDMQGAAKDALEYWQKRTDEKIGDREAFEGVIENLVKHARKVRK
ncbi:hypothetical protein DCS_05258 [Drechmeria coniospora]|uniref:Uncharacterized protein n=1 Tax=Drechmeria coniospora TaxID=98403 RepID=A0A151GMA7_DRECN|nr:hypothetical protein DCS_05258 [Drechmeria coniospora]KYK58245.1 hypothetical protein DCS_05258 [Drechmeria coniospora]ODA82917.1 hypothetical protein RJ55_01426 [Drechmeria coniospora]